MSGMSGVKHVSIYNPRLGRLRGGAKEVGKSCLFFFVALGRSQRSWGFRW